MKLYVDLDSLQFIEAPGFRSPVSSLRFKRGDSARLDVVFLTNGTTPATIGDPETLAIIFGAKLNGQYGTDYVVSATDWTMPATADDPYVCYPSFNTVALDAALGIGGTELASVEIMAEITWREGTGEPTSTRTVLVVVDNDVNRGTEGTPLASPSPDEWLSARAVRHDTEQVIDDAQARRNIKAGESLEVAAWGRLSGAGYLYAGEGVLIGSIIYNFVTTPSVEGEVSDYYHLTQVIADGDGLNPPHPDVTAYVDGNDMVVVSRIPGANGNAIGLDCYGPASWGALTLQGGSNGSELGIRGNAQTLIGWDLTQNSSMTLLLAYQMAHEQYANVTLPELLWWIQSTFEADYTFYGTKYFAGQVYLNSFTTFGNQATLWSGQAASAATSAMSRSLVDARQVYIRQPSNQIVNNSATPVDSSLQVALGIGVWEISASLTTSSASTSTPGIRFKLVFTGALNADGYDRFTFIQSTSGGSNANVQAVALNANYDSPSASTAHFTVISPSVIRVTSAGTLKVQFSQKTATAENTTLSLVSTLLARRISH